ncbi:MAG: hypothetical protein AAB676_10160, partial [Verrucomicrobiota bacterium]
MVDNSLFSPPAWGWSAAINTLTAVAGVFPTRVGMVRCDRAFWPLLPGFPHPRGDGPLRLGEVGPGPEFSPP